MQGQVQHFSHQINISPDDTSTSFIKEKKKIVGLNFKATSMMWFKQSGSESSDYLSFTLNINFSVAAES